MKKIFTIVFCAFCALSLQATVVEIGAGGTGTTSYAPIYVDGTTYVSLTQMLYLSSEITPSGITKGTITAISFYSKDFLGTSAIPKTREIEVWIDLVNSTSFSGDYFYGKSSSNPVAGTKVFSGTITLPIAEGWYTIPLDSPIEWDSSISSKKNIIITINDISKTRTATAAKKHKTYTATSNRTRYKKGENDGNCFNASNTWNIEGTVMNDIPIIKFTFEGGDDPEPEPAIDATGTTAIGVIDPVFETKDVELTITGENLEEDVTIACAAGLSCTVSQIDKNAAMAEGGTQVTISTTNDFNVEGTKVTFTSGTATKEVTITGSVASYYCPTFPTAFNYDNAIVSPYFGYVYYNASKLTISEVNNNHFKPYGNATFTVDYSGVNIACAEAGKVSNLRGKFVSESEFKAFSFDYEAPELSAIVINENEDNSTDWPEAAQSGKELLITRTIVPNEWNSIVLPTDLTSTEVTNDFGSGTDVEEFTGAVVSSSNITLLFTKKTDGIVAGVPYLIKPTQALPNPLHLTNHSFTPTASTVPKNGIEFVGVLVPTLMDATGDDFIFVGSGNTLLHPSSAGTIKGMRAYFHVIGTEAKAALKTAKISMNTGSTTELVLVKDNQVKPYKTMVNDQIVIVNEGKQINILGQIVK